jgi:4-amino-4-deoxy-L-arabinose transferase-like glycosyltransferase
MKTFPWIKSLLLIFFVLICVVYYSGISSVPFHPDESTQIYTSADVFQWFQNPLNLAYTGSTVVDDRMRYRLIDSPLTRTLIGLGLRISNQNSVKTDWDWSKSWAENSQAGALPNPDVLLTARWSVAWMFPLSYLFLFLITKKLGGWGAAVLSVLLFSTNALILIHTRRAMAESVLICLLCASVWCLLCVDKRFWITAISIGLAINSKQTLFPFLGIGLLDIFFRHGNQSFKHTRLLPIGIFVAVVLIISWILNPVYWKSPLSAIQAGIDFRTDLSDRMKTDYHSSFRPLEQSAILIGQVFIEPPAVADVGNYKIDTLMQEKDYFRNPVNNLFRGFASGAIFLGLTIFGWVILTGKLFAKQEPNRYPVGTFLVISVVLILTITLLTPVHFQRYYAALVPLFIVAQAIALNSIGTSIYQRIKKGLPG